MQRLKSFEDAMLVCMYPAALVFCHSTSRITYLPLHLSVEGALTNFLKHKDAGRR